jgi:exodeoxyribonuclease VII small subunit
LSTGGAFEGTDPLRAIVVLSCRVAPSGVLATLGSTVSPVHPMSQSEQPERSFEQALSELEQRVKQLDSGELPLEQALDLFEQGVALVQECHDKLDLAERRIAELTESAAGPQEHPFEPRD